MARARQTRVHGAESESQQREFLEQYELEQRLRIQQPHDQGGIQLVNRSEPRIRRFEIFKSTPLGLIFPQNCQFQLNQVDIDHDGWSNTKLKPKHNPKYVTSDMKWWKVKWCLPPTMKVYPCQTDGRISTPVSLTTRGDIQGLPSPSPLDLSGDGEHKYHKRRPRDKDGSKPYPLVIIKYPGWQGLTQFSADLTVYNISRSMHYTQSSSREPPQDIRSHWKITRLGFSRQYIVTTIPTSPSLPVLKWRSSKTILNLPEMQDGYPKANGNLKLEDQDTRLVAVYKQRRDWHVLGSLTVFTEQLRNGVSMEVVVASCLAIVAYERIGWQNAFGL